MLIRIDESQPDYIWYGPHKLKTGQSSLIIPTENIGSFTQEYKFKIEDDTILKHFIVLLGLNVCPKELAEFKKLHNILSMIANIIDNVDKENETTTVYCITDYTEYDTWKALRVADNGELQTGPADRLCIVHGMVS